MNGEHEKIEILSVKPLFVERTVLQGKKVCFKSSASADIHKQTISCLLRHCKLDIVELFAVEQLVGEQWTSLHVIYCPDGK